MFHLGDMSTKKHQTRRKRNAKTIEARGRHVAELTGMIGLSSQRSRWRLFKAATRGPPKRAHEIVQLQERERLFQNRRCSDADCETLL
jgi:hypothetical protein